MNALERNAAICNLVRQGVPMVRVGERYGISRQRVEQILRRDRYRARHTVTKALQSGRIARASNCERCGKSCKTQAHHGDYSCRLAVEWLCESCHRTRHMAERHDAVMARKAIRAQRRWLANQRKQEQRDIQKGEIRRQRAARAARELRRLTTRLGRSPSYGELASVVLRRPIGWNSGAPILGGWLNIGRLRPGYPYWRRLQALYRYCGVALLPRGSIPGVPRGHGKRQKFLAA